MTSTVAIVGRPNVGKSTLFNRLIGRREAIVDKTPGVTRDRREGEANLGGMAFNAIDTAGFETAGGESLEARSWLQTEAALADADAVLLVIDAISGITPADEEFAQLVRAQHLPVVLVANKCEGGASDAGFYEAFGLGFGEPVAVSAEHALGLADLYEALAPILDYPKEDVDDFFEEGEDEAPIEVEYGPLRLAVAGRQNVGKSTLINRLMGRDRVLTGPEPGVTRDAIHIEWEFEGRKVQLIDTAGLRRRARVTGKLEKLAAANTRRGVAKAQVTVLVIDGQSPMERQDLTVANMALDMGRALVVAVNKWDLVTDRPGFLKALEGRLGDSLPQVKGVPIVTVSALTGEGMEDFMPTVFRAFDLWSTRVSTGALNRWLADALERQPPPMVKGRTLRFRYITQAGAQPPTFVLFANRPKDVPDSYLRFALNDLRKNFDLPGVPIRMTLRISGKKR
jgi:GTP-binding protein